MVSWYELMLFLSVNKNTYSSNPDVMTKQFRRTPISAIRYVAMILVLLIVSGCATTSPDKDPYENMNREILDFNLSSDKYVLKPIAKGYSKIPSPIRNGIGNALSNLREPYTILNDLLQGKFRKAGRDTGRFVINSTLGLLGLADVATEMDLPRQREDFGQTLAVWGVPSGPYLVLPFLGPSNLRDAFGLVPTYAGADPVNLNSPERYYATGLRFIGVRANLLPFDDVFELQPDKYLFLREAYRQRRAMLISDGELSVDDGEDDLLDELLEDDAL